jgi:hypothetical protein
MEQIDALRQRVRDLDSLAAFQQRTGEQLFEQLAASHNHEQQLLEALEEFDALAKNQYTGTRAAMTALQQALDHGAAAIAKYKEAVK